jgi:predicted RND superfamily exporter protein
MPNFFEKRDRWGHGLAVYVLALLVFLLPLIGYGLKQVRFKNDVREWLPKGDQDSRILAWHDAHFQRYDTFLVSWDDSSLDDPRIGRFIDLVQGAPDADGKRTGGLPGVEGVSGPNEFLSRMMDAGIPREEAIGRLQGVLIGSGYLKVRLTDAGRAQRADVERQLADYADSQLEVAVQFFPAARSESPHPNGKREATIADERSAMDAPPVEQFVFPAHDFQVGWTGLHPKADGVDRFREFARSLESAGAPLVEDSFFAPGAPVALFVRIMPGMSRELRVLMPAIQQAAVDAGIEEPAFHMAGTAVGQWQLDVESSKSVWNRTVPVWRLYKRSPFLLSGIVGMLVAYVLLRSLRLATLVLMVSVYSAAVTVIMIPLLGPRLGAPGTLNIVLSVMPNLLLVLTASGAIHMANYWRRAALRDSRTAIAEAFRVAWKPCAMASVTTAIGMASLGTSGLVPVRDFGLYSALGTCLSLLMILYGFPSILAVFGGLPGRFQELETGGWRRLGHFLAEHHRVSNAAFLAAFLLGVWGLRYFHTETKVIRYFPDDKRIVQDYNAIEQSLAGAVTVDAVIYFDPQSQERMNILERIELVRAVEQSLDGTPGVSGTLSLADFRPVSQPPAAGAGRLERIAYGRKAQRTQNEIFGAQAEAASQLVTHVQEPLEFVRGGHLSAAAWLRSRLLGNGPEALTGGRTIRFVPATDAAPDDAPADGSEASDEQARAGGRSEIWRIRAQTEMTSNVSYTDLVREVDQRIAAVLQDHKGVDHVVTGMVPLFLRTQQAIIESLITSFGLAFLVISATMIVLLRSIPSGLLAMIPNVWPIAIVFGYVSLAGVPIDIGTMITGSIAMGIAIDGTVHLLTWFQEAIREGHSRKEAVACALGHCGPALWQTSVAISLAMLMLIFTDLMLISRFGWIMSACVVAAMLADLVLTPALLAGPLGGLIERSVQRRMASENSLPDLRPHIVSRSVPASK